MTGPDLHGSIEPGRVPPTGTLSATLSSETHAPASVPTDARPSASREIPPEAVRSSLRYSIKDGMAWSVMIGAGERYVQPFVILGQASLYSLAAIAALPILAGALVQWAAASVTDAVGRRKTIFVWCARIQSLTWLPICLSIFLPPPLGFSVMLGSFVAYMGLHNFGIPAWNSVMGDLVPADRRGRYFGIRNMLVGSIIVVSFLAGGWWLRYCQRTPALALLGLSSQAFGFLVLFLIACVARQLSAWFLSRMCEPQYRRRSSDDFSLWQFIRRAPQANFGRFVFYCALLRMGGWVVGPFFNWYLLDQLGYSTLSFAMIGTVHLIAYHSVQPFAGRLADRVGSKRVLALGGIGVVGIPILLLFSDNLYYLMAVMLYDGACWGSFDMAAANYLFDIVTPGKRARCTAYNACLLYTSPSPRDS